MLVFPELYQGTVEEFVPGDGFIVFYRSISYVGLIRAPAIAGDRFNTSCLMLHPGHPGTGKEPGILDIDVLKGCSAIKIPNATFLPIYKIENMRSSADEEPPVGSLVAFRGRVGITALQNISDWRVFDVEDGSEISLSGQHYIWFKAWRITTPGQSGEMIEVCSKG